MQTAGAATRKLRRPNSVLVRGTNKSPRIAYCQTEAGDDNNRSVDILEIGWTGATDTVKTADVTLNWIS